MARETVGLGSVANDGTGDTLRDGGTKINNNFTELYGGWRKHLSGRKYFIVPFANVQSGSASGQNTIRFTPFMLTEAVTITGLRACVATLSGTGNVQLAIYASNSTTLMPTGTALASTGNLSAAATGEIGATISQTSVTLQPGLYWAAANNSDNTIALTSISSAQPWMGWAVGVSSAGNIFQSATNISVSATFAQTFGTWPDMTANTTTVATSATAINPMIAFVTA
jgi:hypothetical protein